MRASFSFRLLLAQDKTRQDKTRHDPHLGSYPRSVWARLMLEDRPWASFRTSLRVIAGGAAVSFTPRVGALLEVEIEAGA